MVTKNIQTDYGALGDGQQVQATITISSTTNPTHLSATTNIWSSSDVGKLITVGGAGPAIGGPFDFYDGPLMTQIASYTDPQHIVLNDNAVRTVSGALKWVEWGHDSNAAFTAFHNDFVGTTTPVTLVIPAGWYGFSSYPFTLSGNPWSMGIRNLTVDGSVGSPTISDFMGMGNGFFLGGGGQIQDTFHDALTHDAFKGQSTITLLNPSDSSIFSANTWNLMTGFDCLGFGNPTDQYWYEYVYITNVNVGTGVLTLQNPLRYTYYANWPIYNSGGNPHLNGPAAIYALDQGWGCTQEYININFIVNEQIAFPGQNITLSGGSSGGGVGGVYPTTNENWTVTNYVMGNPEMDKLNDNVTFENTTLDQFGFQSPSPTTMYLNNVTVSQMNGTPKNTIINGGSVSGDTSFGHGSGASESVTATNWTINNLMPGGVSETDLWGAGGYSFSNGIISRPLGAGTGVNPQWAQPGHPAYFISGALGRCAGFNILSMTSDGTNVYINTDLGASLPLVPGGAVGTSATPTAVQAHDCLSLSFYNCIGCPHAIAYSNLPKGIPKGSYWDQTFTTIMPTPNNNIWLVPVFGTLISMQVIVSVPYIGTGTPLFSLSNPFYKDVNGTKGQSWNPQVDLTKTGTRTITPTSVTNTSTGSADNLGTAPGAIWLSSQQMFAAASIDMTGATQLPTVRLIIQTDQGIISTTTTGVAPLRLRLI